MGLRRATELRYPALLASRVEARGLAAELAAPLPAAIRAAIFDIWDTEVTGAADAFLGSELGPDLAEVKCSLRS